MRDLATIHVSVSWPQGRSANWSFIETIIARRITCTLVYEFEHVFPAIQGVYQAGTGSHQPKNLFAPNQDVVSLSRIVFPSQCAFSSRINAALLGSFSFQRSLQRSLQRSPKKQILQFPNCLKHSIIGNTISGK